MQTKMMTAAVLAAFSIGSANAAHRPHLAAQQVKPDLVASHAAIPTGTLDTLYDQFATATTNGVVSDDSSSGSDSYDAEAADDFVVPADGWTVQQVNFMGFAAAGSTPVNNWTETSNVYIYADDSGAPGAAVCSYPAAANTYDSTTAVISVPLPTPCPLTAGTYWVGIQAVNIWADTQQQHYVLSSTPQANSMAVWQNPGGAFGTDCSSFMPLTQCGEFDDPDLAFQILGTQTESNDIIFQDGFDGT